MAILEDKEARLRNLIVPAAASLVGAGAGLVLTRKPVRTALPDRDKIGELTDDLREKLDSVVGKVQSSSAFAQVTRSSHTHRLDARELEERVRARAQHRSQRRARR